MNQKPRIGYACLNLDILPNDYKTCRKQNVTPEKLRELISHNLTVLSKTIDYNIDHHNTMFRISSSLIPFGSSEINTLDWATEFKEEFDLIKTKCQTHDIRLSIHPGQYTVLNSPTKSVVQASIEELNYHATLLELLSGNPNHKMILHVGGVYGDKDAAIERFVTVANNRLTDLIKKYLVIENDDRLFTLEDVLNISRQTNIPVIFDNLHHEVNPSLGELSKSELLIAVSQSWSDHDGKMKVHYSQQDLNKKPGAHSETIFLDRFMRDYQELYQQVETDIMLEVKDKNRSFVKVNTLFHPNQKELESEWAKYKYWVMARSPQTYNQLRSMFKDNAKVDPIQFYTLVDGLRELPLNIGYQINALEHIWGYFKKVHQPREKVKYLLYIESLRTNESDVMKVYRFLHSLATKYQVNYLLNSYFFK